MEELLSKETLNGHNYIIIIFSKLILDEIAKIQQINLNDLNIA